jgi:hypothetical protein
VSSTDIKSSEITKWDPGLTERVMGVVDVGVLAELPPHRMVDFLERVVTHTIFQDQL